MTCKDCGGLVTWQGPLTNLTHTECQKCGAINNQAPEDEYIDCDPDRDMAMNDDPGMQ